jgi:hypothetical protein
MRHKYAVEIRTIDTDDRQPSQYLAGAQAGVDEDVGRFT